MDDSGAKHRMEDSKPLRARKLDLHQSNPTVQKESG